MSKIKRSLNIYIFPLRVKDFLFGSGKILLFFLKKNDAFYNAPSFQASSLSLFPKKHNVENVLRMVRRLFRECRSGFIKCRDEVKGR